MSGSVITGQGSVLTTAGDRQGVPGGTFPGFGGTPAPLGNAVPGASGLVPDGAHGHPILSVTNAANLTALVVTSMLDGTPCYVSGRDAVFRLSTSTRTVNTWDTIASATAGRLWLRDGYVSLKNASVTAWGVDTAAGSDDAAGGIATPLRTVSELAWRLYGAVVPASVTVTIVGSMVSTDLPIFTFRCLPAASFTFVGTPVVIYTSTIGVVTTAAAGAGVGDNNFTDPAVPGGTFTIAGALADAVIGTRTNGTAAYFWFAKDKGATTVRTSVPSAALVAADTYTASTLPTFQVMRFAEQRYSSINIRFARIATGPWTDSSLRFDRCWMTAGATLPGVSYLNCAFNANTVNEATTSRGFILTNGMCRSTGSGQLIYTGSLATSRITGSFTWQGAGLNVQTGFAVIDNSDQYCNDYTSATGGCLTASYWGVILWYGGAIVGSGNTNFLFWVERYSTIAYQGAPVAVAGSSPSATPIQVNGTGAVAVAGLPVAVNANGNGIFLTA